MCQPVVCSLAANLLTLLFAIVVLLTIGAKTEKQKPPPLCSPLTPETPKVNCFQKNPLPHPHSSPSTSTPISTRGLLPIFKNTHTCKLIQIFFRVGKKKK